MKRCDFAPTDLDRVVLDAVDPGWTLDRALARERVCLTDDGAETLRQVAEHGCQSGCCTPFIYYADTWRFFRKYRDLLRDRLRDQVEEGLFENANGVVSAVLSFACYKDARDKADLEEAAAKALYGNLYDAEGPVEPDCDMKNVANAIVWGAVEDLASRYDWNEKEDVEDDQ